MSEGEAKLLQCAQDKGIRRGTWIIGESQLTEKRGEILMEPTEVPVNLLLPWLEASGLPDQPGPSGPVKTVYQY